MIEHDEDELRSAFEALRKQDCAGAPPFDLASTTVYNAKPRGTFARPIILSAAAAAVFAMAVATHRVRSRLTSPVGETPNVTVSITAWKSPTRALLRTPGRELIAPKPLLSSVLGEMRVPPVLPPRKGD